MFNTKALEELKVYVGSILSMPEEIYIMLSKQYCETEMEKVFAKVNFDEIVDFLNRLIDSCLHRPYEYSKVSDPIKTYAISEEELERFYALAEEAEKIPIEDLSKIAPLLTTRSFMEMCRLVYDNTTVWQYPEDLSTVYLFCEGRICTYTHREIFSIDWDDAEQFAKAYTWMYHPEELWFGGPLFYISDESAKYMQTKPAGESSVLFLQSGSNGWYTEPKIYEHWTGRITSRSWGRRDVFRAVRMYIVLREHGYPVYMPENKEVCDIYCQKKENKYW